MDDLYILIIVLLFFLSGVYRRFQKEQALAKERKRTLTSAQPIPSANAKAFPKEMPPPPPVTPPESPLPDRPTTFLKKKEATRTARHVMTQKESSVSAAPPSTLSSPSPAPDIRLRGKADARRAFIYSEIFTRKY